MNLSLFADPPLAAADIERKVTFQKRQFEKKLIELGYEALRTDSTNIIEAYSRTVPGNFDTRHRMAYEKYCNTCLFAFNRMNAVATRDPEGKAQPVITFGSSNPLPSILTFARHAMAATSATPDAMYEYPFMEHFKICVIIIANCYYHRIIPASIDLHNFSKDMYV